MKRSRTYFGLISAVVLTAVAFVSGVAVAQSPKFEIADIQPSPQMVPQFMRNAAQHNGRYEIRSMTMVDLIHAAYDFDADKILGGPSWLEMDRFDVTAKVPDDASPEEMKPMLQSLLADRFKLVLHKDTKPLPTYALIAGRKPQLKAADGTGETGCKIQQSSTPPAQVAVRFSMNGTVFSLGPDLAIQYQCRNMTMEAFAAGLRNMLGASVGTNPVLDQTGLKGAWNFDVKWSLQMNGGQIGDAADRISVFDAVDKQLGLKLEQQQVPTPVIVVDSVNEKPTPDRPGVVEALQVTPPTAFEVADVKPSNTEGRGGRMGVQPGGRLNMENIVMMTLLIRAFNVNNTDQIVGIPGWAGTDRFTITAKAPATPNFTLDMNSVSPLLRALLEDRFKLKTHTEDRPVNAYTLVAAKPKMKKADPASRTNCKYTNAPPGSPAGTQVLTCQNITMDQFADQLQNAAQGLNWPILNSTGIEGGWDFTVTYNRQAGMNLGGGRSGDAPPSANEAPSASDPGGGLTIFEAVEKQLGLKLEMQKRPMPIVVIDHLEEKPTDN